MKRALLENHRMLLNPGVIDKRGFLSAIFALKASSVAEGTTVDIKIEHCSTENGDFEAVPDTEVYPTLSVGKKPGTLEGIIISEEEDINIDIDLVGCKQFIKIAAKFKDKNGVDAEVTYSSAVVLGDAITVPV